jgi:hypothetical protein
MLLRLPDQQDLPEGWLADLDELRGDAWIEGCPEPLAPVAPDLPQPVDAASRGMLDEDLSRATGPLQSISLNIFAYETEEIAAAAFALWPDEVIVGEQLTQPREMKCTRSVKTGLLLRGHTTGMLGAAYDSAFLIVQDGRFVHVWKANGTRAAAGPAALNSIARDWFPVSRHVSPDATTDLLAMLPGTAEAPDGFIVLGE